MIFIIRHGERPPKTPPPYGVDVDGNQNDHSLVPRGWERARALTRLFTSADSQSGSTLATPDRLIAPDYGDPVKNTKRRPYETLLPLNELLHVEIDTTLFAKERNLASGNPSLPRQRA